jgi:hypothetical protein
MDATELKKLAADPRFIEGIYNYCDRWCKRCVHKSRCLSYAAEEKMADAGELDLESDAFWRHLESMFEIARELILSIAKEEGIDLTELAAPTAIAPPDNRADLFSHELSRAVGEYEALTQSWFEQHPIAMGPAFEDESADEGEEAVQIVRWYQYQIRAKLHRGLHGRERSIREQDPTLLGDANGSAKVALIGIDRSIGAWAILNRAYPQASVMTRKILLCLERLRRRVEAQFPSARAFQRPGFDYSPAVH